MNFQVNKNTCGEMSFGGEQYKKYTVLEKGILCVQLLLMRYIKKQSLKPVDNENDYILDKWYLRFINNREDFVEGFLGVDFDESYRDCPDIIFIILILYSFHISQTIRNMCATIRSDIRLMSLTPAIILSLLEDGSEIKPAEEVLQYLYKSNELFILRDDPFGITEEPNIYLNDILLNTCKGRHELYFYPKTPYRIVACADGINFRFGNPYSELFEIVHAQHESDDGLGIAILLVGKHGIGKKTMLKVICHRLNVPCIVLDTTWLYASKSQSYKRLFDEMALRHGVILVPDIELISSMPYKFRLLQEAFTQHQCCIVFTVNEKNICPPSFLSAMDRIIEVSDLSSQEREEIWKTLLPKKLMSIAGGLASLYRLTPAKIQSAYKIAMQRSIMEGETIHPQALEQACNQVQQQSFEGLAVETVSPSATLERLVLSDENMAVFRQILDAARTHETVMADWGFADHLTTGKGLCILFDGPPGTGKTYSAEVLANTLHRSLKRVHMPNIVSKWVGETGQNIVKLFEAAKTGNAIMLLDEADALMSKRSEQTSKATDRYANMEINILLQEVERFDGITILTTNLPNSLDPALERRIQFRLSFKSPGPLEREQLWRKLIPAKTPLEPSIDFGRLAKKYELSGGNIKNAVLHAAYAACAENSAIQERHLFMAAESECRKLGLLVRQILPEAKGV